MGKKRPIAKPAAGNDKTSKQFSALVWVGSFALLLLSFLLVRYALQHRPLISAESEIPESPPSQTEDAAPQSPDITQEEQALAEQYNLQFEPLNANEPLQPIDPSHWNLMIVNQEHTLPPDFTVDLMEVTGGQMVEKQVAYYIEMLLEDAAQQGLDLIVVSGYRSLAQQEKLIRGQMYRYVLQGLSIEEARQKAEASLDPPGASEHHTGLAVDLVSADYRAMDAGFADTAAFLWLSENAFRYGLVLRYPHGKQSETGRQPQPWHYRFVGVENALAMRRHALCLEEYLEQAPRQL